jgi:PAS domain S-box-containing protein
MRVRELLARPRYWIWLAVVAGTYIGAAKLGLHLSVAHGVITPVWPPAGIALAALVLGGLRFWPAVFVGALVANATSGASIEMAAVIAVGNTLEAVAGAYLLDRVGFRPSFERVRDVIAFSVLAAIFSTTLSATNGVTALWIADDPAADPYGSAWRLWWVGDAMGDFLVAPLILVWATRFPWAITKRKAAEGLVLLGLLIGTSCVVFLAGLWRFPYLLFPLLIWATFRFKQFGAATASFVVATVAVAGVVAELTPITDNATRGVEVLQALLAVVAVSLLILAATLSERERAEVALQSAHERLAEAQAVAQMGSWEWEIESGEAVWSDELYRIFGLPLGAEVDYASYRRRLHPAERERARRVIEEALESRSTFDITHRIVRPDGSTRWIQGHGKPILDESGRVVRMIGTAHDITERRRLEEVRENILATVSHELRTPLTSITGFALTLRERGDELGPEVRRELLRNLTEQAFKLERLLSDLLDLDRLREGRAELALEEADLTEIAARVAAAHGPVEVVGEPVTAFVDRAKIERILVNLVTNAVKHTAPGTRIVVSVSADGDDSALIQVDDEGPGVAEGDRDMIFELFSRSPRDGAEVPGAGVGLALVAQFAALHDGEAWVQDGEGGGASFRVRLPRRTVS